MVKQKKIQQRYRLCTQARSYRGGEGALAPPETNQQGAIFPKIAKSAKNTPKAEYFF